MHECAMNELTFTIVSRALNRNAYAVFPLVPGLPLVMLSTLSRSAHHGREQSHNAILWGVEEAAEHDSRGRLTYRGRSESGVWRVWIAYIVDFVGVGVVVACVLGAAGLDFCSCINDIPPPPRKSYEGKICLFCFRPC